MLKKENASWYAVKHPDIKFVRDKVFGAFDEPYEEINSGVWGDYYNSIDDDEEAIKVYNNRDGDGELNEHTLSEYPILIQVGDVADWAPYDRVILNDPELQAVLYERREWEDDENAD